MVVAIAIVGGLALLGLLDMFFSHSDYSGLVGLGSMMLVIALVVFALVK